MNSNIKFLDKSFIEESSSISSHSITWIERGLAEPMIRVQIPVGANQIFDDKLMFSSQAKEKEFSAARFGSITETESALL